MKTIVLDDVLKTDLSPISHLVRGRERECYQDAKLRQRGKGHHFKFLGYVSKLFRNSVFLDIGTRNGASALALALEASNSVHTFDIKGHFRPERWGDRRIKFHRTPAMKIDDMLLHKASAIYLDIDHTGKTERLFYDKLKNMNYQGLLILDDIHLQRFGDMEGFWSSIDNPKWDVTDVSHWSGFGLVDFGTGIKVV